METQERVRMTLAAIEALYPEHWVLIDEPDVDEFNNVVDGILVLADTDKKEFYRRATELKLKKTAVHCTKREPPGTRYLMNYYVGPDGSLVSIFDRSKWQVKLKGNAE